MCCYVSQPLPTGRLDTDSDSLITTTISIIPSSWLRIKTPDLGREQSSSRGWQLTMCRDARGSHKLEWASAVDTYCVEAKGAAENPQGTASPNHKNGSFHGAGAATVGRPGPRSTLLCLGVVRGSETNLNGSHPKVSFC